MPGDGCQFVFGLNHGIGGFAGFGIVPVAFQINDERFHQRRRRRDGIPRNHRDAGEQRAQRAGGVAIDDDLASRSVHPLHAEGIGLGESLGGVIVAGLRGAPVQIGSLSLALTELPNQRRVHFRHLNREQPGDDAIVNHIAHQLAQFGVGANRSDQFVEGDGVEVYVGTELL